MRTSRARAVKAAVRRAHAGTPVILAVMVGGLAFTAAAPSLASDKPKPGGLGSVAGGIFKSSGATFTASYKIVKQNGQTQSVTFSQKPPNEAIVTSSGSFFVSKSAVTACTKSGGKWSCHSLPESVFGMLSAGLTDLFAPHYVGSELTALEAEAAAHDVSVSTSSGTYGGMASTCITAHGGKMKAPATFCASNSNGILTYGASNGTSLTLTSYSGSPAASAFTPPAKAVVITLPKGVTIPTGVTLPKGVTLPPGVTLPKSP